MTFSIVAIDAESGEVGSAVASCSVAVGGTVSYSRMGVGVVNTQHYADLRLGEQVLEAMDSGTSPQSALDGALDAGERAPLRQLIAIDRHSRKAAFTGAACTEVKRHRFGEGCVAAGNMLASDRVVERMIEAFEDGKGERLGERLMRALEAGQAEGGDRRGQQSAAVKVVPPWGGETAINLDLRVDDHERPLIELRRLHQMFRREYPAP